ncbi:hypothetical protein LCM10_18770 [Rossellomorea aquimaris]|uniref:hypothetical protein n=1 Tax=Rossellomorea aquimaris TaxID=189382 RepID=UPI001CD73202|nr:hypothetical protein [Rossellomorea aquimaris]MCA1057011.1 hypothetical protein [Rossellomorea aquimaris]
MEEWTYQKRESVEKVLFVLLIFFYVIYVPVSIIQWFAGDGGITALVVGIALPYMRKNHIEQIRVKQSGGA